MTPLQEWTRAQWVGLGLVIGLLALTTLGGVVRVTDSGLACPDWPGCYGAVFPSGDFGEHSAYQVWLEWTHRLVAMLIGFVILGWAFWTLRRWRTRQRVWVPAAAAVALLAVQVMLGALTVTEQLEDEIVTSHLAAAMLITMLVTASWLGTWEWRWTPSPEQGLRDVDSSAQVKRYAWLAVTAALLTLAVVIVGSYVTHIDVTPEHGAQPGPGAGACWRSWPFCHGDLWPTGLYARWNMSHRLLVVAAGAAIVAGAFGVVMLRPRSRAATMMMHAGALLYLGQIALGAEMIRLDFANELRALHLSAGAITWTLIGGSAAVALYRAGAKPLPPEGEDEENEEDQGEEEHEPPPEAILEVTEQTEAVEQVRD